MHARTTLVRALVTGAVLSLAAAAPVGAQAFAYPSFQVPRISQREFNFGLADADGATSLLFQWREGMGNRNQLSLDVGFADTDGDENVLFLGGQWARQLTTANATMPFDLAFTLGAGFARTEVADEGLTIIRVPVGVSAGHVFPLEGGMSITPYIHPRFLLARCSSDFCDDETELGLEFDIGGEFRFNPAFAVRLSAAFGDEDTFNDDSFGVSLAWTPGGVARSRR
jgi:hypothetical protein